MTRRKPRLRILPNSIPRSMAAVDLAREFELTEGSKCDAALLCCLDHLARRRDDPLSIELELLESGGTTVVFHELDDWNYPTPWDDVARKVSLAATVTAIRQLPVALAGPPFLPLLYPPYVQCSPGPVRDLDLVFQGWFTPSQHDADVPPPVNADPNRWEGDASAWSGPGGEHRQEWSRQLSLRGRALEELRDGLPNRRLCIRNENYWWAADSVREEIADTYCNVMGRARVAFVPPGRGPNTIRMSEAFAAEAVILSPNLAEVVAMPEPERWRSEDFYCSYSWDRTDLVQRAEQAIALGNSERESKVQAGLRYFERWGSPPAQVSRLAEALRQAVS